MHAQQQKMSHQQTFVNHPQVNGEGQSEQKIAFFVKFSCCFLFRFHRHQSVGHFTDGVRCKHPNVQNQ